MAAADSMTQASFHAFQGSEGFLESLLGLRIPPLAANRNPLRQLRYIQSYVAKLECSSLIIEDNYIDRDYIEDHSIFYSRNREHLPNFCKRVHFFKSVSRSVLENRFEELADALPKNEKAQEQACQTFSQDHYLGFMVIKPLAGCPVGRTVLHTYPQDAGNGRVREFRGALHYDVHLLGIRLSVVGLAFQQQDEGVSACATTALWSSLQKLRSTEDVSAATPAQITTLASRFSMPFGRSMPSEGLNLDQMCQSIHALGLSPDVLRTPTYEVARGVIYAASLSETTPILLIAHDKLGRHAVTVAGVKRTATHALSPLGVLLDDRSGDLRGLYLHDDRIGPYVSTELSPLDPDLKKAWKKYPGINPDAAQLTIATGGGQEKWLLTHVLTPIHAKIRLSVNQVRLIAYDVAEMLNQALLFKGFSRKRIGFGVRILREYTYVRKLLLDPNTSSTRRANFFKQISPSRYIGLIRLQSPATGRFDVLVDTTGTPRNARCLGIIYRDKPNELSEQVGAALADYYGCPFVT